MKNLGLKIWSLLIAIALSVFVQSQSNRGMVTLLVPVELRNIPQNKILLLPKLPQAQVRLRGPSYLLSNVASSPPSIVFRVPPDVGERFTVSLQSSAFATPAGVEVLSIDPPEIEFIFDELVSKSFPLIVPRIGQLEGDLKLERIEILPENVVVTGPKTELQGLPNVETTPVDLRGITQTSQRELELRVPGRFSKLAVNKVSVRIVVSTLTQERRFSSIPIQPPAGSSAHFLFRPAVATVEVSGPRRRIKRLAANELRVEPKLEPAASGSMTVPLEVTLPEGISLVELDPEKVSVRISESSARNKK